MSISNRLKVLLVLLLALPIGANAQLIHGPATTGNPYVVSWDSAVVPGFTKYIVLESSNGGSSWSSVYQGTGLSVTLTGRAPGTYLYRYKNCRLIHMGGGEYVESCLYVYDGGSSPAEVSVQVTPNLENINPEGTPDMLSTSSAGQLDFSTGVSNGGSAQISIPINLPVGPKGVQPSLAISYASSSPQSVLEEQEIHGVLGYGWDLSGISSIRRCRHGVGGGLAFNNTDQLCLDGQRLVPVSGFYWSDNTEYRTEINSFVKVVARGSASNRWFEVYDAQGGRHKYGLNQSARGTKSSVEISWALEESMDDFGQVRTITHYKNASTGLTYPLEINYGNVEVEFLYEQRSDSGQVTPTALPTRDIALNTINIEVSNKKVRQYRLQGSLAGNYFRLDKVQVCGYDINGNNPRCLAPTTFSWTQLSTSDPNSPFKNVVSTVNNGLGDNWNFYYTVIDGQDPNHSRNIAMSSWYGSFTAPSGVITRNIQRALVHDARVPDGKGSYERTIYHYTGMPYYDSNGRGYIGFQHTRDFHYQRSIYNPATDSTETLFEFYSKQHRLDFPYQGKLARVLGYTRLASPADYRIHLRREWDWDHMHIGTLKFPYVSQVYDWNYELDASASHRWLSGTKTTNTYCFRNLSGDSCTSNGGPYEYPTQLKTVTQTGDYVNVPGGSGVWGDVGVGSVNTVKRYDERIQNFDTNNSSTNWSVGFVEREVAKQGFTSAQHTQVATATRNATYSNAVKTQRQFPGDSTYDLTQTYAYTSAGSLSGLTVAGANITTRSTSAGSFTHSVLPQSLTNEKGHTSTLSYDLRHGLPKSVTDANSNLTSIQYDEFGRETQITTADGTTTSISYESCGTVSCTMVTWAAPRIRITVTTDNGGQAAPTRRTYLDASGQVVLEEVEAFSSGSGWSRVETHRYQDGRVARRSLPYFSTGGSPVFEEYHYGFRGRVVKQERADGSSVSTSYVGAVTGELTVEVTESGTGNKKQSKFNALKQLTSTIDGYTSSDAVTTVYTYDGRGLLDRVTVDGVETADMDYDVAGNRYQIDDQSSGLTQFVFDSLGQVTQKTDAKGQITRYTYDVLGRLTQRIDGYLGSGSITNDWVYDTAANGKGLLQSRSNPYVSETFVYDTHSRLVNRRATFSVSGYPGNGLYSTHQSYDSKGRPSVTTYPNNVAVTQTYSSRGYPYQLKRGSALLEQVETMDAFGNVTREKYGSNLYTNRIFDPSSGRLTSVETGTTSSPRYVQDLLYTWRTNSTLLKRTDQRDTASDLVETFTYDSMNRVKYATTTGGASRTKQFLYDRKGNLTLHTSNVSGDVDITGYTYHSTDKNRLLSFSRSGVSNQLSYDANGNVTRYTRSGDDRFIDYNAANQATRITIGSSASTSSPAARDEYWYGPDGERLARKASWSDGGLKVSWVGYVPGVSMERVYPVHDGSTSYRDKMMPSDNVLLRYVVQAGSSSVHTQYLHRDHLGSVESVTSGTSEIRSLAYDAFGARRSSNWSEDITSGELANVQLDLDVYTQHGYTDHEHLDRTGLIHMQGRIYDPEIGRFLQPDPFVQAPSYSQSHNRYAYTFNSPLNYTDPTGFTSEPQECVNGVGALCDGDGLSGRDVPELRPIGRASDNPLSELIRRENNRRVLESLDQQINRGNTGVRRNGQTGQCPQGCHSGGITAPIVTPELQAYTDRFYSNLVEDYVFFFGLYHAATGQYYFSGDDTSRIFGAVSALPMVAYVKPVGAAAKTGVLYQKVGPNGEHLKFGVSTNPAGRYTSAQLGGGRLRILTRGEWERMLALERKLHETLPIGPEEGQSFYIKKQVESGLRPPPYGD